MTELAFDGNAALQMTPTEAPTQAGAGKEEKKGVRRARTKIKTKAKERFKPKWGWKTAPKAVATIVCVAAFVVMILVSYAQLVIANDEVVGLRNDLHTLQTEETKLMAQYELAYDLQEIESQMLASGQMTKIQNWQTYTLELSEPDSVEYYQGWDIKERVTSFAKNLVTAVKEYF